MMKKGYYIDIDIAKQIKMFLLNNKNYLSKDDLMRFLEVIIENYEDFGGFYDDYADNCYEDIVLEPLGEILFDKDLDEII